MAILRNKSQQGFTIVDNYALKDKRLSLKATGLLVKMLSLPDYWEFSEAGLAAIVKDGITSIRSAIKAAVCGVLFEGFAITQLPAATAEMSGAMRS